MSSHQVQGVGVADRTSVATGWDALLGQRRGAIDVGTAEVFREEDVTDASTI